MPIVGLLHHGSGPPNTSLIDPEFPRLFARFAGRVAERYPWIERFTPINEPLTTARFSTLYGHWYPHSRSVGDFARAMVVQCQATVAAMQAIREVTPGAMLVQTEDLGKTHAVASLQYQADFENERRWLTFDMLSGHVHGTHPMCGYLRMGGVSDTELETLAEAPCPPDIIGVNHYLTSERFLDARLARYPTSACGGNGQHRYADVEAVRVLRDELAGPYTLLREAWERYHLPVAVTEAHLACTREQQLRWLDEVWRGAVQLRNEGADVVAVTAWSAFGAHDWSSLLTRDDGVYEPGLFDIRAPAPRATALARMVQSLASCGRYDDPVVRGPGWWRCDQRVIYAGVSAGPSTPPPALGVRVAGDVPPLLIVGATGTLGRAVTRACEARGIAHRALARCDLDIADAAAVVSALEACTPWAVVNCAGFVRVDDAEREPHACRRGNVDGAVALATACASLGMSFVTFSTDLVFDGANDAAYVETDAVAPVCEYGRSKAEAELGVLAVHPDAFVVRTAAFFGDQDEHNFVTRALRSLAAGEPYTAISDVVVSPTYVPDLVDAMLDLLIDRERGIWHSGKRRRRHLGGVGSARCASGRRQYGNAARSTHRVAGAPGDSATEHGACERARDGAVTARWRVRQICAGSGMGTCATTTFINDSWPYAQPCHRARRMKYDTDTNRKHRRRSEDRHHRRGPYRAGGRLSPSRAGIHELHDAGKPT